MVCQSRFKSGHDLTGLQPSAAGAIMSRRGLKRSAFGARNEQRAMTSPWQSSRAVRLGVAGLMSLLTTGCAGAGRTSPTAPSASSQVSISPGAYLFVASVSATSLLPGSSATVVGCSGSGTVVGVSTSSFVTLSQEGSTWVARSTTPADGDVEIRFGESAPIVGQVQVAGTARGTVVDRRAAQTHGSVSLRLSGATAAGAVLNGGFYTWPGPLLLRQRHRDIYCGYCGELHRRWRLRTSAVDDSEAGALRGEPLVFIANAET